jgi:hypothetical protein
VNILETPSASIVESAEENPETSGTKENDKQVSPADARTWMWKFGYAMRSLRKQHEEIRRLTCSHSLARNCAALIPLHSFGFAGGDYNHRQLGPRRSDQTPVSECRLGMIGDRDMIGTSNCPAHQVARIHFP